MTFKEAKRVIRQALSTATDSKLIEVLEAARAGEMPWASLRYCLAARLYGCPWSKEQDVISSAYAYLGWGRGMILKSRHRRQRILVPMLLAEIRHRGRASDLDGIEEVASIAELVGDRP